MGLSNKQHHMGSVQSESLKIQLSVALQNIPYPVTINMVNGTQKVMNSMTTSNIGFLMSSRTSSIRNMAESAGIKDGILLE